jgi:dTDP-D-glucose 4,6-dehydratase
MRKLLDSSRLAAMGWRASTRLRDGLQRTYDWARANEPTFDAIVPATSTTDSASGRGSTT